MAELGIPEENIPEKEDVPTLPGNVVHEEHYKIRYPNGMYSAGGSWGSKSKKGKVWRRKCDLSSHLCGGCNYPFGCVVEKTTRLCIEKKEDIMDITEYLQEMAIAKLEAEKKRLEAQEREEKRERYEMYLKLKKEFDK